MSKETILPDPQVAGSRASPLVFKLAVSFGNLKSKGIAGCHVSRAVQAFLLFLSITFITVKLPTIVALSN